MADYLFERGEEIATGSHGDHDYVYASGEPVPDTGPSTLVFESGVGIGGGIIIDSFEDGDLAEYEVMQGGPTSVTTQSSFLNPVDGDVMLSASTSSNGNGTGIISTSGLPTYPMAGDKFGCYTALQNDARAQIFFGSQGVGEPGYFVRLSERTDNAYNGNPGIRIGKNGQTDYLATKDYSFTTGVWYDVQVDWQTDGTIYVELLQNEVVEASLEATDTEYTGGGIGFRTDSQTGNVTILYDYMRKL